MGWGRPWRRSISVRRRSASSRRSCSRAAGSITYPLVCAYRPCWRGRHVVGLGGASAREPRERGWHFYHCGRPASREREEKPNHSLPASRSSRVSAWPPAIHRSFTSRRPRSSSFGQRLALRRRNQRVHLARRGSAPGRRRDRAAVSGTRGTIGRISSAPPSVPGRSRSMDGRDVRAVGEADRDRLAPSKP